MAFLQSVNCTMTWIQLTLFFTGEAAYVRACHSELRKQKTNGRASDPAIGPLKKTCIFYKQIAYLYSISTWILG